MADEIVEQVDPTTTVEAETPEIQDSNLETWSEADRNEYFKSGTVPSKETSAPPESGAQPEQAKPEAAGEPEPPQQAGKPERPPQNAETRKRQLAAEIQEKLAERRRVSEETEILRAQLELLRSQMAQKPESPAGKEQPSITARPVRPKLEEFTTYEDYEVALDKYEESLADWKVADRIERERTEWIRRQEEAVAYQRQQQVRQKMDAGIKAAKEKHVDFDEVMQGASNAPVSPHMQNYFENASESPAEVMYFLGTHPEDAQRIAALDPYRCSLELAKIEFTLTGTVSQPPAKPQITAAHPPPTQLAGTNAAPADEVAAAVASGDFRRYMNLANARDTKR